ncbi:MAG TPA: hypothetical protein VJS67_12465 [Pseudonocardiaceae bacterium]|nr:hypothetical protein [Pseudonocardiaceae bacterium]
MRLLDAVLGATAAARSVDDATMVLTDVGSGMRGISAVSSGGPLGVLPVVIVPTVAAGVGVVVAICVVVTAAGPLVVGVQTALISPFELAYSAVACVGVLAHLSVLGSVVVAVSARVAGPVVVVGPVGVVGPVVVVVPVGVVAMVPAHVALPIMIFRPTRAQEGQTQVGHWSAASRVHRVYVPQQLRREMLPAASNLKVHKCLVNLHSHFSFPPR